MRLLHLSDLHLDCPFDGLSAAKAAERRDELYEVLADIISAGETHAVDAILISGDLFDRPNVSHEAANLTARIFASTKALIFITPGNHDYYSSSSPYSLTEWPENVHIFRHSAIETFELESLMIYGAAFTSPTMSRSVLKGFSTKNQIITGGLPQSKPSVMVLHGELNPHTPLYNPIYSSDIASSGLTYLALGHVHNYTTGHAGATVYSYPGCSAGRGFDELGPKGYNMITINPDTHEVTVEHKIVGARQYHLLNLNQTGIQNASEHILNNLPADSSRDLYKINLEGQADPSLIDINKITSDIAHAVYYSKITDLTSPPLDIWKYSDKNTLAGTFLNLLRQKSETGKTIELAADYGFAALTGKEPPQP